jgi:UDP-N-acetylglucosamine 4,6-dehydratase
VVKKQNTRFSVERYGNVIDSRGSVIPYFRDLIKKKKKSLPVTDIKMTRFFLSLDQGVKFVKQFFEIMRGGEIFIPKLPSLHIVNLVKAFGPNIKHHVIGIRPGEKLNEALCTKDDSHLILEFKDYYVIQPSTRGDEKRKNYSISINKEKGKKVANNFEYNSLTNQDKLSINEIKKLLKDS